uniref:Reverse transcriptase zinc-binding domain-containing protein n=1 Tax=Triticum urartu TaxID=4572 RepID=A0A8R7V8T8_TRIUA
MATEVTVGDGQRANFWHDRWLLGQCPKIIAPALFKISARKNRTIHEALQAETWLSDLSRGLTDQMLPELLRLAALLDTVQLHDGQDDSIAWHFTESHEYTARSAYLLQFEGSVPMENYNLIWRAWAPEKCRFFIWTAALGRILTADVLLRRGWENNYFCTLCERNLETTAHLFWDCPWSKQVWGKIARLTNMSALQPQSW